MSCVVEASRVTPAVVKLASAPLLVPASLVATSRKWYVVLGERLETVAVTVRSLAPEPALFDDVFDPYAVLVPYSKYQVVARPSGFTLPLSVADVGVTAVAGAVTALGSPLVENVASAPRVVPASLVATRR